MSLRRFGLLAFLPVLALAYACGDDDDNNTITGTSDAGALDSGGGSHVDTGATTGDDAGDGGTDTDADAGPTLGCVGNPLGDIDAGATLADAGLTTIATGPFLDGPQWIDDGDGGSIVYSEVNFQNIVQNNPTGTSRVVLRATGPGNLPIGNAATGGFVYTALSHSGDAGTGGAILRMFLDGGSPTQFPPGEASSPNDIVASSKGIVYFTDPGYQTDGVSTGVFAMDSTGAVTTITKFDGGTGSRADGIALSADQSTLFVGFFDLKKITKYTIDAQGVASSPTDLTITLADNPTGIAVDTAGNLWIAENATALTGRIEVFSATGQKWGEIPFSDSHPTGIAFGGADNKTVFITTERGETDNGTLYTMPARCAGVR